MEIRCTEETMAGMEAGDAPLYVIEHHQGVPAYPSHEHEGGQFPCFYPWPPQASSEGAVSGEEADFAGGGVGDGDTPVG